MPREKPMLVNRQLLPKIFPCSDPPTTTRKELKLDNI